MKKYNLISAIILLLFIMVSCDGNKTKYKTFNVIYCFEWDSRKVTYCVDNKPIFYNNKSLTPKYIANYTNGKLNVLYVSKPEGCLAYTYEELKSDTLFASYLGIPLEREITIQQDRIFDNNACFTCENKGDSLFVNNDGRIIIYTLSDD